MLVVNRFRVPPEDRAQFLASARTAVQVLAGRPGYRSGRVACSTDDPGLCLLVTDWESVGTYRRALGAYEVKLHVHPLLYQALDEPSAYEVLLADDGDGVVEHGSDLAAAHPPPGPGAPAAGPGGRTGVHGRRGAADSLEGPGRT